MRSLISLIPRRSLIVGAVAVGLALSLSSFGVVRARTTPDTNKVCNKSGACLNVTNNGTGAAVTMTSVAQNTRALFVYATNSGADGSDINGGYIGIIGRAPAGTGTYPLVLTDQNGTDLDFTDGAGNLFIHGSLINFARTRWGQAMTEYTPRSTTPSVEDVGTAHMINGQATVRLDSWYAQSIDLRVPYHVFLTPDGDTRGLFVAQRTPSGFTVREVQGGRGTLDFEYRIVSTSIGQTNQRMGLSSINMPHTQ